MARGSLLIVALGTLALAGCGATTSSARGSADIITREQLASLEVISVYDAIQRLQPTWLQSRGTVSLAGGRAEPRVHINDSRSAELVDLRSMSIDGVDSIRWFSAADATTLFGTGYPGGLIEVRTRR